MRKHVVFFAVMAAIAFLLYHQVHRFAPALLVIAGLGTSIAMWLKISAADTSSVAYRIIPYGLLTASAGITMYGTGPTVSLLVLGMALVFFASMTIAHTDAFEHEDVNWGYTLLATTALGLVWTGLLRTLYIPQQGIVLSALVGIGLTTFFGYWVASSIRKVPRVGRYELDSYQLGDYTKYPESSGRYAYTPPYD